MAKCRTTNIDKVKFFEWYNSLGISCKEFEERVCCKGCVSNIRCRERISTIVYSLMLKEFQLPAGSFIKVEEPEPIEETVGFTQEEIKYCENDVKSLLDIMKSIDSKLDTIIDMEKKVVIKKEK